MNTTSDNTMKRHSNLIMQIIFAALIAFISVSAINAQDPPQAAPKETPAKEPQKKGFNSRDIDKNGTLTKEEFATGMETSTPEKIQQKFRNLDKNKDGVLTKDEFFGKSSESKGGGK